MNTPRNEYLETLDRLEHDICMIDAAVFHASASISLRRIADSLHVIATHLVPKRPPVSLHIALPTITRGGLPVPNTEISNTWVLTVPIVTDDAAGGVVPPPAGDVFTAVSSDPASLSAAVGVDSSNNPVVVLTPLVRVASDITVTLTDSVGLAADTAIFDIVEDTSPTSDHLDLTDATHTTQPRPAA